jgi:hypothetical protein
MSIPCKFERSIVSHDEYEIILRSHHPEIYDAGLDDLKALRQRLRDMRLLMGPCHVPRGALHAPKCSAARRMTRARRAASICAVRDSDPGGHQGIACRLCAGTDAD